KKPAAVMTLAVISSEGDVMVLHFFQANETRVVVPWMKKTAGERKYTFQQDSAPAHKAKTVQNYLEANTAHFWPPTFWLANSPDLNPCDFYLLQHLPQVNGIVEGLNQAHDGLLGPARGVQGCQKLPASSGDRN
ncbi:Uncharacterized protein FKW44_018710, partial [Caligus rogercresseyi]